jgi:hypothetical protein
VAVLEGNRGASDDGTDAWVETVHQRSFREFAEQAASRLPLYRYLCERVARDPEVAGLLALARPGQQVPNLLLAAVHDVLLAGEGRPLDRWYGSLADPPHPVGNGADDPWPRFREVAMEHPWVRRDLRIRSTQTNEVGRCTALLPALTQLAADAPGAPHGGERPLGLVEVGASAGLNLLVDRYGYEYRPGHHHVGHRSVLTLHCDLRGPLVPPLGADPPPIASRVGLDHHPVDLSDRAQARWLVACQWPDQPERIHRARTAIALAHGTPPRVVAGDAVDDVAALVRAVAGHALPVVIATWALAYLEPGRQAAFLVELDQVGAERDLSLVLAEQPERVPGLAVPPRPDGRPDGAPTALVRVDWRDGVRSSTRLADLHPHGTWLEWLQR